MQHNKENLFELYLNGYIYFHEVTLQYSSKKAQSTAGKKECYVTFKQTNQITHLQKLANRSALNKGHVIKLTKVCTVTFMKTRNSLTVRCREKQLNWKKNKRW